MIFHFSLNKPSKNNIFIAIGLITTLTSQLIFPAGVILEFRTVHVVSGPHSSKAS